MNINLILKGILVGVGKIIPGISGSLLAMTLGIYDDLILAITHFFENFRKNVKFLSQFSLGVIIAIFFFSHIISFFLVNYRNETIILFLGLIIGTLLNFSKQLIINKKNVLIFILGMTVILSLCSLKSENYYTFTSSSVDYVYTLFLGAIDAFSSVVPGISGTAIYMLLGVYEYVLNVLSNPFSLNFLVYGLGLGLGLIITCFIMAYFLKNKKDEIYSLIFAFMTSSIIILGKTLLSSINILLICLFILGIFLGSLFDK